jgi:hypothetical protein
LDIVSDFTIQVPGGGQNRRVIHFLSVSYS